MKIETIAQVLQTAGIGTIGTDLFYHTMPDVEEGVLLRLPLNGVRVDPELPLFFRTKLQVILRTLTFAEIDARAQEIIDTLVMQRRQFPGLWINYIRLYTLPITFPRSEGNTLETSINFDCCYVMG